MHTVSSPSTVLMGNEDLEDGGDRCAAGDGDGGELVDGGGGGRESPKCSSCRAPRAACSVSGDESEAEGNEGGNGAGVVTGSSTRMVARIAGCGSVGDIVLLVRCLCDRSNLPPERVGESTWSSRNAGAGTQVGATFSGTTAVSS
jgi:hypothetical protein